MNFIVCLDPGHSGKDSGSVGPSGVQEKNLTLSIAKSLAVMLVKEGFQPLLTRVDDCYLPVTARPLLAHEKKADLFLSIHCNASENHTAEGIETLYGAGRPESQKFAEAIQHAMMMGNPMHKDRGAKASPSPEYGRDIYVVKCIDPLIPAALVEVEFLSHKDQEKWIIESVDHIANCLFLGINYYFNEKSKKEDLQ